MTSPVEATIAEAWEAERKETISTGTQRMPCQIMSFSAARAMITE